MNSQEFSKINETNENKSVEKPLNLFENENVDATVARINNSSSLENRDNITNTFDSQTRLNLMSPTMTMKTDM